jgi:uncharacterized membrane protein YdbT with pleckstrin-like domain
MRYVEKNLTEGERVIYSTRRHWKVMAPSACLAAILVATGIALLWNMPQSSIPGLIVLCVAVLVFLGGWIRRNGFEFAVTNKRLIYRKGIISISTDELFLAKIESIFVKQGLIGRWLDYGTVTVRGIGGSWEPFADIAQPLLLRRRIQEQTEARAEPIPR